jgi:EAL domain-containing protein (putative c-di-GMP-specific phosphodiesterase class I)
MNEPILQSILAYERPALTYSHSIVGLKDGRIMAKEILTRFEDEKGVVRTVGDLLVDATLPPESRVRLDLLCLGEVFTALERNPVTDHLLFVNLDPLTLEHPGFWYQIEPWLWNLSIPPHRIVFEITESYSRLDLEQMEHFSKKLRNLGVRIAVDDLGSGIASLAHMGRLSPDFFKVDKSLVRDVHRRPYQAALLNALAVFAERMRVGYIAEGIEMPEELQAVIDADVPWGQGFIFGEPEPLVFPAKG